MTPLYLKTTKICFVLLIFCAANTSFAIKPHVLDSARAYNHDSSGSFIAHQPDRKEQKILKAQLIKETKALDRSERYAKKIVQRSYKAQRPGNGKQTGWFILWLFNGVGMLLGTAFFGLIYAILLDEGESGAGLVLGGAIVSALMFVLIFIKLLGWKKKFPGNKSVKS